MKAYAKIIIGFVILAIGLILIKGGCREIGLSKLNETKLNSSMQVESH